MDIYHSIHTITLQRKIPLGEVSSYRSLLYGLSDRYGTGSYRKSENEYYFYMYAPQGVMISLSLIHISEPTRPVVTSRMPSSA